MYAQAHGSSDHDHAGCQVSGSEVAETWPGTARWGAILRWARMAVQADSETQVKLAIDGVVLGPRDMDREIGLTPTGRYDTGEDCVRRRNEIRDLYFEHLP